MEEGDGGEGDAEGGGSASAVLGPPGPTHLSLVQAVAAGKG